MLSKDKNGYTIETIQKSMYGRCCFMEHIIKEIIGKSDQALTEEHRELLFFLYENLHIEELEEEDRKDFMESFMDIETLSDMTAYKSSFVEMIREIENNIPSIDLADRLSDSMERKYYTARKLRDGKPNELNKQTIKKGNVVFVPFHK